METVSRTSTVASERPWYNSREVEIRALATSILEQGANPMPSKRPKPKFSRALAEPIYEPVSIGLFAAPEDEEKRQARITGRMLGKFELLFEHYNIDKPHPDCWLALCVCLASDFVPGMQVEECRRRTPGRRRTWKAGLGADLLRAVEQRLKEQPSRIRDALDHLRKTDPEWRRHPPQSLAARLREAKRASKWNTFGIAKLLSEDRPLTLAKLAEAYAASQASAGRMAGLFGLGEAALNKTLPKSDENSES